MTITTSQSVPNCQMNRYHELVKANNGYYVHEPLPLWSSFRVEVAFERIEDFKSFCEAWQQSTTPLREIKSTVHRRVWRKIVGRWRNRSL